MVICRLEPPAADGTGGSELFAGQDRIRALDLADYRRGVKALCRHLGVV